MSEKKKWKELRKQLKEQGCEVIQPPGRSHLKVYHDGTLVTVLQQSNSSYRAYQNKICELRRKGLKVK